MTYSARPHRALFVTCCILLTFITGCGPPGARGPRPQRGIPADRALVKTKEPPKPPPAKAVPLDPQLRSAARQELAAAAKSSQAQLRAHAIEGARYAYPVIGADAAKHIVAGLGDSEPLVRFAAAMAAGELKLEDARTSLGRIVEDPDPRVQVAVRFALHKLGDDSRTHDLEQFAVDAVPGHQSVRVAVATVLGRLGEPTGVKILKVLRRDEATSVRQEAGEALYRLGDEQGVRDMIGLTASGYPDDQMFGLLALASRNDQRVRAHVRLALSSALSNEFPEVALVAARSMGMLGSDAGYAIAQNGAKSKDPRQRLLAALAFGAIGRSDAQEILAGLLKDADPTVRVAAATAALQLNAPGREQAQGAAR
jgi:HEAT repeat protein